MIFLVNNDNCSDYTDESSAFGPLPVAAGLGFPTHEFVHGRTNAEQTRRAAGRHLRVACGRWLELCLDHGGASSVFF